MVLRINCKAASENDLGVSNSPSPNIRLLARISESIASRDRVMSEQRGRRREEKPALSKRQQQNREAQRTHREKKERYIKAIEDEVIRLADLYSVVRRENEELHIKTRQLGELLLCGSVNDSDDGSPSTNTNYNPWTNIFYDDKYSGLLAGPMRG